MYNDGLQNVYCVEDLTVTGEEDTGFQDVLFSSLTDTDGDTPSFTNIPFVEAFPNGKKSIIVKDITTTGFKIAMSKIGVSYSSITANLKIAGN